MLYSRYSSPMDLISRYIAQGRFGAFIDGFFKAEYERRKEESEKNLDLKLWIAYVHSDSKDNYATWKRKVNKGGSKAKAANSDESLDTDGMKAIIDDLFPNSSP